PFLKGRPFNRSSGAWARQYWCARALMSGLWEWAPAAFGGDGLVQRTGTATLQWLVGLFCAGIGTLMLVAPHQFAAAAYSALKPHLPWWGAFFLVGGSGLMGVAALRPRRLVVVAAHTWAGLALISLSGGFIASSHLPGISNYAILGIGTILVVLVPHRWRERLLLGQDSFATVLGVAIAVNGCY